MANKKKIKKSVFCLCALSQILLFGALCQIDKGFLNPPVFAKEYKEHTSFGARINPADKTVSFKLFTFPDAKKVYVIIMNKENPERFQALRLQNMGDGIFQKIKISKNLVKEGDRYKYLIIKNDGTYALVKDPCSFKQEEIDGASIVYDNSKFRWKNDKKWKYNKNRISRSADKKNKLKIPREVRIYELSPDTLTSFSSYEGVKTKLKYIKELGFNTIEIMHIENTHSYNWGYDGVDKYAPSQYLGGPDKLKELVDAAHGEGLNVVFDVIPNHHGPDGNQLRKTGPYIGGYTPWGDAYNYDGEHYEYVRDYMINAFLNWAENYHVDGFRLDMTKAMKSDYTMKQIAAEMNYHFPEVFLIAEDARGGVKVDDYGHYWTDPLEMHDKRVANPLKGEEYGKGLNQKEHAKRIREIINYNTNLVNLGMDLEWDFYFYHKMNDAMQDTVTYSPELMFSVFASQDNLKYIDSHDEVGDRNGSRKIVEIMCKKLGLREEIELNKEDIKRAKELLKLEDKKASSDRTIKTLQDAKEEIKTQKAEFACEMLAIYLQTGRLEKYRTGPRIYPKEEKRIKAEFKKEILKPLGIKKDSFIVVKNIEAAFKESCDEYKMATAVLFGIPGAKMIFQGCEDFDLTPFRFFREFKSEGCEDRPYVEGEYTKEEKEIIKQVLKQNSPKKKKRNIFAFIKNIFKKVIKEYLLSDFYQKKQKDYCAAIRQIESGYEPGETALLVSTMGRIEYSERAKKYMNMFAQNIKDLNKINEENPALKFGYIDPTTVTQYRQAGILGFNSIYKDNEIFVLANFGKSDYKKNDKTPYYIRFPRGKWVEIMNTDDKKYGGSGKYLNRGIIKSEGNVGESVNIGQYSTIYFKRVK